MGERKGQNKYYPPDFDPKKHGNLNAYHGTHALRERARKLDKGILIIRFEMPYNIWCLGCNAHIAQSVRYNAEKKKVDMYLTTPIHEFKMKCHLCDMHFIIRTDPKNMDYVILSGARRKEQRWDMAENEQIVTDDKADIKRMSVDPMFSLEHAAHDESKLQKLMPTLRELEDVKSEWKDDYRLNSLMRSQFRAEKKSLNEEKAKDQAYLDKWNLDIKLVKEDENDIKIASLYKLNAIKSFDDEIIDRAEKRKLIESESIFGTSRKKKSLTSPVSLAKAVSTSLSPGDYKKRQLAEGLCQKINKSVQESKINSTGFGNSSSSKSSPLVLVKKVNSKEATNSSSLEIVSPQINELGGKGLPNNPLSGLIASYNSSDSD